MMKLSDYVIRFLEEQGVRNIFMVAGGGAMHLIDSLGQSKKIKYTCNLHEQATAIATEAYARVKGELGVAIVTSGPGSLNTLTGLAGAWYDSTACLFISGQVKTTDLVGYSGVRQIGLQETDIISIVNSLCKYAVQIPTPSSIRYHLEKAMWLATTGRPGPVWLDIPVDIQAAQVESESLIGYDKPHDASDVMVDGIDEYFHILTSAKRPLILAGNGIRLAGTEEEFLKFVDRFGIPVVTSRQATDLIPASHPMCFGIPGDVARRSTNLIVQNCDALFILGARLDQRLTAYNWKGFAPHAKRIMVDIDQAEIDRLGLFIDVAIRLDLAEFFRTALTQPIPRECYRSAWIDQCRYWQRRYPVVRPEHFDTNKPLSMYAFSKVLSDECPANAIILSGSSGLAMDIFAYQVFEVKAGQRVFYNKGTVSMGLGIPAAIGASLACPGRPVISVEGDGGFQLNIHELEVVRRLGLPIEMFVINNGGYAMIRQSQMTHFGRLTGADASSGMTLPCLRDLVRAYGLHYTRVDDCDYNCRDIVPLVMKCPTPIVCEVFVDPDEVRSPRVLSQMVDGKMVSGTLENMYPYLSDEELQENMAVGEQ